MKIKVDENIGISGVNFLRRGGHDVASLDRDFGHVPRLPPSQSAGVAILELGEPASSQLLHDRLRDFLSLAANRPIDGELWIVEPGRVRVRAGRDEE